VTVLLDILEWSRTRPQWQQDALRRLVLNGEVAESDVQERRRQLSVCEVFEMYVVSMRLLQSNTLVSAQPG